MDTTRAAKLMTRVAWSAVIALAALLLVNWLEEKSALRECLMEELMGEHGDRQTATFRGAGGDNDINTSLEIARLNCKSGRKPILY